MNDNKGSRSPLQGEALGLWWAVAIVVGVSILLLMVPASRFGLWEPWETSWAELGRAMRLSGDWLNPQLGGQSAPRPLLTVWLIALGNVLGGGGELGMRLPMGLSITSGALLLFVWLRRPFGNLRAMLASIAVLISPMVLISGMSLAGNGVFIGALIATVSTFGILMTGRGPTRSRVASVGLAVTLTLCVGSGGLWGLFIPALMIGAVGAMRAHREPTEQLSARRRWIIGGVLAAVILAAGGWLGWQQANPLAIQVMVLLVVGATVIALHLAAGRTRVLKQLGGPWVLLVYAAPLVAAVALGLLYQGDLGPNVVAGDNRIPALTLLLDNYLQTPSALDAHVSFDFWLHQIGFGALPWTALLPLALAYLVRRDEGMAATDGDERPDDPRDDSHRIVLAWFFVPFVLMTFTGTLDREYLFPGVASIGVAAMLMLTDRSFWRWMRSKPALLRTAGFAILMGIIFLFKDLERFPDDLLGPLLTDGKFEFPKGFGYGVGLKVARNTLLVVFGLFFFGAISTTTRLIKGFRSRRDRHATAAPEAVSLDGEVPMRSELAADEALRAAPGVLGTLTRWTEAPLRFTLILGVLVVLWGALVGFSWVPKVSDHLSLKGLLTSYERSATDGQPLTTYQVPKAQSSYYLANLESIQGPTALKKRFDGSERFYFILPRDRLSSVNYEIRKATKPRRNVHVLDNRSSRFVLASNQLGQGETEQSPVANAILPERPHPIFSITAKDDEGQKAYPQFDGRIQLLGYEVYRPDDVDEWGQPTEEAHARLAALAKSGELPVFATGKTMVIRYFFKVLKRVPSAYKIFLHVDFPGTRINGDHVPVDGTMATNTWLPGDYIVDTQYLPVERGSSSGSYEIFMGFFQGSRRMKVEPKTAHDGVNRVRMGKVNIATF